MCVCVCRVFIKAPGSSPLQGKPACAKRAAYPGQPPPAIPILESLAVPPAYCEAPVRGTGSRPKCCHGARQGGPKQKQRNLNHPPPQGLPPRGPRRAAFGCGV